MWTNNAMLLNGQAKHTHIDTVENTSETILVTENADGDWVTVPNSGTRGSPQNDSPYSRSGGTGFYEPWHRNDREETRV